MILLQSSSRYLLQILSTRLQNLEKGVNWIANGLNLMMSDTIFSSACARAVDLPSLILTSLQANVKNPDLLFLSVSIPAPPPETTFVNGLPPGAIEAIKATYGVVLQILDPPRAGFNLTVKLSLLKLPADEEHKQALLVKIYYIREVVLGAPLRAILNQFFSRTARSDLNQPVSLIHRPNEAFFVFPQEFVEARRTPGLSNALLCLWSPSSPQELQGACSESLSANAGFVSFVLRRFHAYPEETSCGVTHRNQFEGWAEQFQLNLRLFADKLQRKRKPFISFGLQIKLLPTDDKSLEGMQHCVDSGYEQQQQNTSRGKD